MKIPYLGKIRLSWCMKCNVPVLSSKCGICEGKTEKVAITPPGDVRPAFKKDIALINETAKNDFGREIIPGGKLVLLNSASAPDRFDEVIMDGRVIGVLKYDLRKRAFVFLPRLSGARILGRTGKRFVEIAKDALPYILEGGSVLMPGVEGFEPGIEKGDEVIVRCGDEIVGVGSARMSGKEAKGMEKGMLVKIRRRAKSEETPPLAGGQDWDSALQANKKVIENYEREAIEFIRDVSERHQKIPKTVAFSGGKDSLVTLLLAKKALPGVSAIFTDTGIELPETIEYTRATAKGLGVELIEESAGDGFWRGVKYFGPPGRDYRWCCKISKLGPTTRLILKHFPDGCVSFIGQRKYESEARARSGRTWRTPWIPIQLCAGPIQNWTALHVWLYIMREGTPANELYEDGMERLGCYTCPASDIAEFETVKHLHPGLWEKWEAALEDSGFSEDEITYGFWRWHRPTEGIKMLADELGVKAPSHKRDTSRSKPIDFKRSANMAKMLGDVDISSDAFSVIGAKVFCDGTIESEDDGSRLLEIIERASNCFGCGVCLGQCKVGAIELRNEQAWIKDGCTGCMKCHEMCPIVKYG